MKKLALFHLICQAIACVLAACQGAVSPPHSTPLDAPRRSNSISQEVALATFDQAWGAIEKVDVERDHAGVDWLSVKEELRPRAMNATSREELRAILRDMLSRLKRSHFEIIPAESSQSPAHSTQQTTTVEGSSTRTHGDSSAALPELAQATDPLESSPSQDTSSGRGSPPASNVNASFGMTLRWIEGHPTVTGVRAHSPAHKADVQMGWIVKSIDGVDLDHASWIQHSDAPGYERDLRLQSEDAGPCDQSETWIFQGNRGEFHAQEITRERNQGISTKLGLLPPFQARCDERVLDQRELRSLGVPEDLHMVVIGFNIWMPAIARAVDDAFQRHLDADGIIIDLRGNPGGAGGMAMGIAGHVMDESKSLGSMRTRDATLEFKVNPRRSTSQGARVEPFAGPVAILVDPLSASTSEIFAGGLQKLDRARVFGRTSAGAALPAQTLLLESGDTLLYAFANFTLPDGSTIEGQGVVPDQITGLRRDDWIPNRDADVNAAARWISSQYQRDSR